MQMMQHGDFFIFCGIYFTEPTEVVARSSRRFYLFSADYIVKSFGVLSKNYF